MSQNSKEFTREIISIEEYLIRRQAVREQESESKGNAADSTAEACAALELAELMYV